MSLAADVRRLLTQLGADPKKRFGQNFMVSEPHLSSIAAALSPDPPVPVLEIGPGLGFLTLFLLERGFQVTAVEKDRVFARSLEKRLNHPSLRVVEGDLLRTSPEALGLNGPFAVAGNIPYNITTPILEWLIERRRTVREAVLTVQKEVAERLLAKPGTKAWGSLTIFARTFADIFPVCAIARGAFFPPPNVDSAAIRVVFLKKPRHGLGDEVTYFALVRLAFQKRRKTLLNALAGGALPGGFELEKPRLSALLEACSIDPCRRPETLSLEEWAKLSVSVLTPKNA